VLQALVDDGRIRELLITKVDGEPVSGSPFREQLVAAGFVAGYRGLVLRRAGRTADLGGEGSWSRSAATSGGSRPH